MTNLINSNGNNSNLPIINYGSQLLRPPKKFNYIYKGRTYVAKYNKFSVLTALHVFYECLINIEIVWTEEIKANLCRATETETETENMIRSCHLSYPIVFSYCLC